MVSTSGHSDNKVFGWRFWGCGSRLLEQQFWGECTKSRGGGPPPQIEISPSSDRYCVPCGLEHPEEVPTCGPVTLIIRVHGKSGFSTPPPHFLGFPQEYQDLWVFSTQIHLNGSSANEQPFQGFGPPPPPKKPPKKYKITPFFGLFLHFWDPPRHFCASGGTDPVGP